MKRMITTLCVLAIALTGVAPAMAAETRSSHYYPVEVREYMEGDSPRIDKVYQLSLADDPGLIPTGDFERDGRLYYLLDMTRKDEIGVDTKLHTQTITKPSSTNDMETILKNLDATIETATEDGYTGVLQLDHTTVKVTTDGYATRTQTVSSTRTYPNLSDADVSLIPKTVEDKGKTLTLADVKWGGSLADRGGGVRDALLRHSDLHRQELVPVRDRVHSHGGLYRRGGQNRLRRGHVHGHVRAVWRRRPRSRTSKTMTRMSNLGRRNSSPPSL